MEIKTVAVPDSDPDRLIEAFSLIALALLRSKQHRAVDPGAQPSVYAVMHRRAGNRS
ncbi:MAG: hypothetical protein LC118_19740 [Dehalococcoidia bacterium]|nr:hypothetical protein [Dehalococcoidia bacterium]